MRFFALLKKELRECLPWAIAAGAFFLIIGNFMLWDTVKFAGGHWYRSFSRYSEVQGYDLIMRPINDIGALLFLSAVGLGLALAVRQFWIDNFTGTWGFTLHRSTGRTTILAAKICAGLISLTAAVGLVWCFLFWLANSPDYLPVPLSRRCFIQGWLVVGMGLLFYLGAGLAGLSRARWFTTKLTGLAFALWMFIVITGQWTLLRGFGTFIIAVIVLLFLILETFLKKEF